MPYNIGIEFGKGHEIFLFPKTSWQALGPTQTPYSVGLGALSTGLKWLGGEFGHSFPSNAELRNEWTYTSAPMCLNYVYKNEFTFTVLGILCYIFVGFEKVNKTHVVCLIGPSPNKWHAVVITACFWGLFVATLATGLHVCAKYEQSFGVAFLCQYILLHTRVP